MTIHVEDLQFQCIIGILDFERKIPQDVIINLTLQYQYDDNFIDYVKVTQLIKDTMIRKKFLLIEDALSTLSKKLKKKFPKIDRLSLKITKPSILPECKVSVSFTKKFNS